MIDIILVILLTFIKESLNTTENIMALLFLWDLLCYLESNSKSEAMKIERYLKSVKNFRLAVKFIIEHNWVEHSDF